MTSPPQAYGPPPAWRPLPVPLAPGGRPLADFGTRLLAHLIDGAILTAIAVVVFVPVLVVFAITRADALAPADPAAPVDLFGAFVGPLLLLELGLIVVLLAGYYVYYVEMMFRSGQTVGKKAMGVRVVPIDPGAQLTRTMAAKRYAVEFVGGVFLPLFFYLDGLWQLWDKPFQQTLHDKFAQTVVIKVSA